MRLLFVPAASAAGFLTLPSIMLQAANIQADARQVIDQMNRRLVNWHRRAKTADEKQKIQERAQEVRVLIELLSSAKSNRIVIDESAEDAYRRGYEAASRKAGPSRHGIVDRRVQLYNCFHAQYNPANEAKRREHNAIQKAKWQDHH